MKNLLNDTEPAGEQMTLFSLAGSRNPASLSARQEKERAQAMTAIYGRRCLESLEKFSHASLWAKTLAVSLIGLGDWYSTRCKLTWRIRATKSHRLYFQLVPKTHRTEGIESGLLPTVKTKMEDCNSERERNTPNIGSMIAMLPTPTSADVFTGNLKSSQQKPGSMHSVNLSNVLQMLPTPKSIDGIVRHSKKMAQKKWENNGDVDLSIALMMLPTPGANDNRDRGSIEDDCIQRRMGLGKSIELSMVVNSKSRGLKLQPGFALWMMGFPEDWTELPFQNGEQKA